MQPERRPSGSLWRTTLDRIGAGRRREREAEAFIAVIRQMAALVQAGRTLPQVWAELAGLHSSCGVEVDPSTVAAPECCLHHVLRHAAAQHRLGEPPLEGVRGPGRPQHWRQLQGALSVAQYSGMSVDELLMRLADALEDGQDAQQARDVATAGPASTARLLMLMPLAGVGLSLSVGASVTELLSSPLGWVVVSTGVGLTVAGHAWTRALIRAAETS